MEMEELGRLDEFEISQPSIYHLVYCCSVHSLYLVLVLNPLLDFSLNVFSSVNKILLQSDSLRYLVAAHRLFLHLSQELYSLLLSLHLFLPN
jgi:hypothetical protein